MTTLPIMREKVRRVTGRYTNVSLTDTYIDFCINTAYQFDFPEELRLLNLKQNLIFYTTPNIDYYNFDYNNYISSEPPVFVAGYPSRWFQDQNEFYSIWPGRQEQSFQTVGDGTAGPYTFTVSQSPIQSARISQPFINESIVAPVEIIQSFVTVSAQDASNTSMVVIDNGQAAFSSIDGTAIPFTSIDYLTGTMTVIFPNSVPSGNQISVQWIPYTPSRPVDCLFWNQQFILRPIPDNVYQVSVVVYVKPTALVGSSSPLLQEWWQLLAYAGAMKVYGDYPNEEGLAYATALYEDQLNKVERRTIKQLSSNRTATIYSSRANTSRYFGYYVPGNAQ